MTKKPMFVSLGVMVAVAAVLEFLIVHYGHPICTFVLTGSNVFALRVAFIATGIAIVAASSIIGIMVRLKHGKRAPDRESDHVALRCFAVAMLLVFVLCFTLYSVGLDAMLFQGAALLCLGTFGSVVAARNKRWGWIIAYLLIFLFFGSLFPAL